ncbi:hypothetical protein BROUX41_000859 [Berkeleyomyces rouxiae]|uniref:uncharacterized protein n=1 Tax=Berkeleyomyces rouxiae TaxID=2035830 RepID=UPI003B7D0FAB
MVSAMTPPYFDNSHVDGRYFATEAETLLGDTMMDSGLDSGIDMSPPMLSRKDSDVVTGPLFPHKPEDAWSVDMQSHPSTTGSSGIPSTAPTFLPVNITSQALIGAANAGNWVMTPGTGPMGVDPMVMPAQFDGMDGTYPMFSQQPIMTPNGTFGDMAMYGDIVTSANVPNSTGNMNMNMDVNVNANVSTINAIHAVSGGSKKSAMAQAVLQELRRGDGIRKKNARFDIPAERNLNNIDHLIAQSNDEQEIKELKQQKRLLRNRQAALDSRQRKKMHTERLEDEKKQFTAIISDMEEELGILRKQCERLAVEKQQFQDYIQRCSAEKENLVREHTVEASNLHKKVTFLTNRLRALENDASTRHGGRGNNPSSPTTTGWNAATAGGALAHSESFGIDPKIKQEASASPQQQHAQQHVPMNQAALSLEETAAEHNAASGRGQSSLLFMLFLVGAYVISNDSSTTAMSILPPVSDDVRMTTTGLLKNLFKEAGVDAPFVGASSASAYAPAASAAATTLSAVSDNWMHMLSSGPDSAVSELSMLGSLGDMLTVPSFEQERESLFTLSTVQYDNTVNTGGSGSSTPRGVSAVTAAAAAAATASSAVTSAGTDLRNLVDSLGAMRSLPSTAEAWSRSLLQDMVPVSVVRNFANLVTETHSRCMTALESAVGVSKA